MKKGEGGSILLDLAKNPIGILPERRSRAKILSFRTPALGRAPARDRDSPYNVRSTSGEHTMHYRKFGRTGWNVSEIGYGMWGLAGWTGSEDAESLAALQRAVDLGCNFFDTAWAYGDGHSEELLGKIVRANRGKKLYMATKVPPKNSKWPARREFLLNDCYPPEYIEKYVDKSLANLGVERLELVRLQPWE